MTWAKVSSGVIAIACVLVIIANAPAVLTDNLVTAVAQIRKNAAKTEPLLVAIPEMENSQNPEAIAAPKKLK